MQRWNAASCLLLALLTRSAHPLQSDRLKVEVIQTHTGVRVGDSPHTNSSLPGSGISRCNGTSGVYSKEYGYHCSDADVRLEANGTDDHSAYTFFYDVNIIMPDNAHVILHCSSILGSACEGVPSYPEKTSVLCHNFVLPGAYYEDCTAFGPPSESIGVYEASLHGDEVTIFGADWKRDYLNYGTWQTATTSFPAPAPTPPQNTASANSAQPPAEEQAIDPQVIIDAKAGDAIAQYKLGYDYYLGHGIAQDYAQAAVWWQKAAEQGNPDAQNNLGVLYNSGKGVPQSYSEAYFWQNLAAARANGDRQSQFAKNRDDSAAKISFFERLRVQKRASQWASKHPVPPQLPPQPQVPAAHTSGDHPPENPKTEAAKPDHP